MSLKHTLKKINSTGDVLLKESINAIVRDMMKTAKINIPPTQPISVFRNIDSLGRRERPEELLTKVNRRDTPYPADLTLTHVKQD
jgi:hypothetical protein